MKHQIVGKYSRSRGSQEHIDWVRASAREELKMPFSKFYNELQVTDL